MIKCQKCLELINNLVEEYPNDCFININHKENIILQLNTERGKLNIGFIQSNIYKKDMNISNIIKEIFEIYSYKDILVGYQLWENKNENTNSFNNRFKKWNNI